MYTILHICSKDVEHAHAVLAQYPLTNRQAARYTASHSANLQGVYITRIYKMCSRACVIKLRSVVYHTNLVLHSGKPYKPCTQPR